MEVNEKHGRCIVDYGCPRTRVCIHREKIVYGSRCTTQSPPPPQHTQSATYVRKQARNITYLTPVPRSPLSTLHPYSVLQVPASIVSPGKASFRRDLDVVDTSRGEGRHVETRMWRESSKWNLKQHEREGGEALTVSEAAGSRPCRVLTSDTREKKLGGGRR